MKRRHCAIALLVFSGCRGLGGSPPDGSANRGVDPDQVPSAWRVWPDGDYGVGPTPDGKQLVYVDWEMGDLRIRDVVTDESRMLISNPESYSTGYPISPRVSRDGHRAVYSWWDAQSDTYRLEVIDLATRERSALRTGTSEYVNPEDWSPDGETILGYRRLDDGTSQVVLVPVDGGEPSVVRSMQWHEPVRMNFSAEGRFIAFDLITDPDGGPDRDVIILDLTTGAEARIGTPGADETLLGWDPSGDRILFLSDRGGSAGAWLIAVEGGRPVGEPRLVRPDFRRVSPIGFLPDGTFWYSVVNSSRMYTDRIDSTTGLLSGRVEPLPADVGQPTFIWGAWSPDGRSIAYRSQLLNSRSATVSIDIYSVETGEVKVLPIRPPLLNDQGGRHRWSVDGRSITFSASDRGRMGLYRVDVQTGRIELLVQADHGEGFGRGGTLVGDTLVYVRTTPEGPSRILVRDLRSGAERVFADSAGQGIVSPDGRLVVTRGRQGGTRIEIVPLHGGDPLEVAVPAGTGFREWTGDSRALLVTARPGVLGPPLGDVFAESEVPCPACPPYDIWRVPIDGSVPAPVGPIRAGNTRTVSMNPLGTQVVWDGGMGGTEVWAMERVPRE